MLNDPRCLLVAAQLSWLQLVRLNSLLEAGMKETRKEWESLPFRRKIHQRMMEKIKKCREENLAEAREKLLSSSTG
jgi:hypothetical protein